MVCAQCGTVADPGSTRCRTCDSDVSSDPQLTVVASESLTAPDHGTRPDTGSPPLTSGSTLAPGQKFAGRYTIIKKIGAGGMGAVYQAWDESLGIAVALKVILLDASTAPGDVQQLEARFKRELLLARQVTHPNVVRIHDLGEIGPTKYLTMAFVDGADLATVLRREGRLPVQRALAIVRQIAEGLSAAHSAGVVHRDLKPANVMVDGEGRALLTDFGIARSVDAATLHTMPGSILGTLDYMAPEQARGEPADRRADVYTLGLIFYELLAGGRPRVKGESGLADLLSRIEKGPPPLGTVTSDVPPDLQRVVTRCLERDPATRYQSAQEVVADLNRLDEDGRARPDVTPRRSRAPLMAAVAVAVVALAGVAWWLLAGRSTPSPPVAREPVSVLIADFENRAGDPVFEGSLEQALAIAIEGASFVTNYPRGAAVKLAGELRPGSSLDAATAQLVAVREEIRVVLAGSISQESGGYRLEVSALRPGTPEPFARVSARAADKAGVLEAVGRMAAELREALGDTEPSGQLKAETFSAASLDAVRAYTIAQDLSTDRKNEQAIEHYKQAVQHDPQFGRAYAGWAVSAFDLGRRAEAEELWKKALSLMDRMTDREKYRTLGAYYIGVARNYEKAIESYEQLVAQYPADLAGHNNLAVAYFYTRNFPKALEEGRRAIEIYPGSLKFRNNYALYAMYAGDFKTAADSAREVVKEDPRYEAAYLPLAMAALSNGDIAAARAAYEQARQAGPAGASLAAIGLADVALYEGRFSDAIAALEEAILVDREARNSYGAATKTVALAEARAAAQGAPAGVKVVENLLTDAPDEFVAVPAGRLLADAKQDARLLRLIADLEKRSQPEAKAYARLLTGERALREGRHADAIEEFSNAVRTADLWLARFDLGVAYVAAGRYAEAISELEACARRRGEATSLFMDDMPTYRHAALLPYWLGRAQQGLNMAGAAATFEQFLRIRSAAVADPLVVDARRRLDSLRQPAGAR